MAISLYDTISLAAIVEQMKLPSQFLLDTFFPGITVSQTEFIAVDVFVGQRRMAPFVSPLLEGKLVESLGMTTNQFKPAYLKPKTRLDPLRPIRRAIGEQIGGRDFSPVEREQQNLAFELDQHITMINRRLEWMAAQALVTGSVTVAGEGYPSQTVNFGRAASLTIAQLTSTAAWTLANITSNSLVPSNNLQDWSALVLQASGLPVTDIIFTPGAWKVFRADPNVKSIIASLNYTAANLQASGVTAKTGGQFMGNWGPWRLWLYYDWYIDPTSLTETAMIPDGTVIMGSDQLNGTRAFGAILDPELGYVAQPYAPKSWTTQDPGARWLMTQSSPLVIPTQVNAALVATVF